ncbi:MAG TPA: 50S ribosomal protein L11 methyltransferase [Anaerolineae bacterium]|nr:50S ribosomal protein L11 methyltransferase [Anaerolineae bacterium]
MAWFEVVVVTNEAVAEAVGEALRPYAIDESVVREQLGDPADLAPMAMLPDVMVKVYLEEEDVTAALRAEIEAVVGEVGEAMAEWGTVSPPQWQRLTKQDWAYAWREHYHPLRVGERLWIKPSWYETADLPTGADDIVIELDPGMAFGTGTHATTQLCLKQVEKMLQPGQTVFDVGTGSGILTIAAAKLGASEVLAVDTEEEAIMATETNLARNGVVEGVRWLRGSLKDVSPGKWDVVVVNILATIIVTLFKEEDLWSYVGDCLILSGIVLAQEEMIQSLIAQVGGQIESVTEQEGWLCFVVRRS